MKYYLISTALLSVASTFCSAQTVSEVSKTLAQDSIKKSYLQQAAIKNPVLRQVNISTDIITKSDITSNLNGNPLFKGKASTIRTAAIFSIPVKSWGKNSISTTVSYFQQNLKVTDVQSFQPGLSNDDLKFNKSTVGLTASFQRGDSLFNRPVYYSASISGLTNDASSIKKISYLAMAIFPLKQTATTRYSLGLVINIDPSLNVPAFVLFNYWHKFNNNLELNVSMPSRIELRKEFSDKLWATAGTSLSGSIAFFQMDRPNIPKDNNYTTMDLKNGAGVEYRLGKKIIVGANGGILVPVSARAFERNQSSGDYFLKNKLGATPYMNFTFSILPFL